MLGVSRARRERRGARSAIVLGAVVAALLAGCAHGGASASDPAAAGRPAEQTRMRADIAYLASVGLAGRRAGTPGSDTAANFIARRLWDLQLPPAFGRSNCTGGSECRASYLQLFRMRDAAATNVGAIITGTDSTFRNEYVVISAHYDHIGRNGTSLRDPAQTAIHPGADDNASGTAAMLELARRFAERPARRSVLILAFGAEEMGLVGSNVFVEHPPIELRRIIIALNLDMIGRLRDDRVTVYGVANPFLRVLLDSANVASRFRLSYEPKSSGRSDDFSFAGRGVPALHITTGEHESYHRTTDTVEGIELGGLARVTDFVERVARVAAGEAPR